MPLRRHRQRVQRLLFAGATIPTNATDCLFAAAWNGPVAAVRLLLRAHACMNAKQQQRGRTALHLAAIAGRRSIVNELLAAGALPDIPGSLGCTALEYAQDVWLPLRRCPAGPATLEER